MQSLASCIGVGLLDDGDLEDVHDFSVGVNRIEDQRCKELASDLGEGREGGRTSARHIYFVY